MEKLMHVVQPESGEIIPHIYKWGSIPLPPGSDDYDVGIKPTIYRPTFKTDSDIVASSVGPYVGHRC